MNQRQGFLPRLVVNGGLFTIEHCIVNILQWCTVLPFSQIINFLYTHSHVLKTMTTKDKYKGKHKRKEKTSMKIHDEKVRSKIFEDLRTPKLEDTVRLIEQMVYDKDTNARIEMRREDSKVAAIGGSSSAKRPF